jgi:hypothetical protein
MVALEARGNPAVAQEAGVGATIRKDEDSYSKPYLRALTEAKDNWSKAGARVKAAEKRTRAAQLALRRLATFNAEIARLLETKTFHALPRFQDHGKPIGDLHILTVGPYRGVFIVRPDGTEVIALVFSEAPHDMASRIAEVANLYPTP